MPWHILKSNNQQAPAGSRALQQGVSSHSCTYSREPMYHLRTSSCGFDVILHVRSIFCAFPHPICPACLHMLSLQLAQNKASEIEALLHRLSDVNDEMGGVIGGAGDARSHTLARHRDILQEFTQASECCQYCYKNCNNCLLFLLASIKQSFQAMPNVTTQRLELDEKRCLFLYQLMRNKDLHLPALARQLSASQQQPVRAVLVSQPHAAVKP